MSADGAALAGDRGGLPESGLLRMQCTEGLTHQQEDEDDEEGEVQMACALTYHSR